MARQRHTGEHVRTALVPSAGASIGRKGPTVKGVYAICSPCFPMPFNAYRPFRKPRTRYDKGFKPSGFLHMNLGGVSDYYIPRLRLLWAACLAAVICRSQRRLRIRLDPQLRFQRLHLRAGSTLIDRSCVSCLYLGTSIRRVLIKAQMPSVEERMRPVGQRAKAQPQEGPCVPCRAVGGQARGPRHAAPAPSYSYR